MLSQLDFKIFGLETIKERYMFDPDFKDVMLTSKDGKSWAKFFVNDGLLFHANKLCIPASSVHLFVVTGSTWWWTHGTFWSQKD
jgi:hypothetical protein